MALAHDIPTRLPIRKPKTADDTRALVARAITALRRIQASRSKRDARIAYYQQKIDDLKHSTRRDETEQLEIIRKIMPRVEEYIEANRFVLTGKGKRKSVAYPDGVFRWQAVRYTDLPKEREEEFLREVRGLNLADLFIRTKYEPNRSALLDVNNREQAQKITTARIVEETRPQLTMPGTSIKIERISAEEADSYSWEVTDSQERF